VVCSTPNAALITPIAVIRTNDATTLWDRPNSPQSVPHTAVPTTNMPPLKRKSPSQAITSEPARPPTPAQVSSQPRPAASRPSDSCAKTGMKDCATGHSRVFAARVMRRTVEASRFRAISRRPLVTIRTADSVCPPVTCPYCRNGSRVTREMAYQNVETHSAVGAPSPVIISPPIAGPITCVMFSAIELSALALLRF